MRLKPVEGESNSSTSVRAGLLSEPNHRLQDQVHITTIAAATATMVIRVGYLRCCRVRAALTSATSGNRSAGLSLRQRLMIRFSSVRSMEITFPRDQMSALLSTL